MNKFLADFKKVDVPKSVLLNFGCFGLPFTVIAYLILMLGALDKMNVSDPLLKLPFLIIIAMSAIWLMQGWNPNLTLVRMKK
jgi:hypothetical protein